MTEPAFERDPRESQNEIARAYDRWSASYDADRNITRDLAAEVLRKPSIDPSGRDVLELGCGTATNTAWLAEHARRVVALDFSAGMLTRARERVRDTRVSFVRHDVRQPWPLSDASVDIVVGTLVLEHVADLDAVLREGARVLRRGGLLLLCELHPERQRLGAQARFIDRSTSETIHIPAYHHAVSEYVNAGLSAGLVLRRLDEWVERAAERNAPPRLLSLLFEKPSR